MNRWERYDTWNPKEKSINHMNQKKKRKKKLTFFWIHLNKMDTFYKSDDDGGFGRRSMTIRKIEHTACRLITQDNKRTSISRSNNEPHLGVKPLPPWRGDTTMFQAAFKDIQFYLGLILNNLCSVSSSPLSPMTVELDIIITMCSQVP